MTSLERRNKIRSMFVLLAVTAFMSVTSVYAFGLLANQNTVNTSGVVADVTLGVYSNSACTQNYTSINWGTCYPGENRTALAYIKNLGTLDATLSIQTINWNPSIAPSFLALNSNYYGQIIAPGSVTPITFTLTVPSDINQVDTFSFDISIISVG